MKDIRRQQMDRDASHPAHGSHKFPDHEARMADHTRRIRSAACECGSGRLYGDCCLNHDYQRSSVYISYSLPRSIHPDLTKRWEIEDHLRVRAFGVFYKAGHDEHNLLIRFVRALVASAGPIRDERQVRRWHRRFCTRPSRKCNGEAQ